MGDGTEANSLRQWMKAINGSLPLSATLHGYEILRLKKKNIPSTNNEGVSVQQQFVKVVWHSQVAGEHQHLVRPNCRHIHKQTSLSMLK